MSEDGSHFCVEKAVRQGHCEPLSGEKDGPEVDKQDMGGGGRVAWAQDRDDVRDPQQWDDHQQGLCCFPILMIGGLSTLARCSQLCHHHCEDGDEEEHVGGKEEKDRTNVNPFQV